MKIDEADYQTRDYWTNSNFLNYSISKKREGEIQRDDCERWIIWTNYQDIQFEEGSNP